MSVDLNLNSCAVLCGSSLNNGSDSLGYSALLAYNSAHIVFGNVKVIHRNASVISLIYRNGNRIRLINESMPSDAVIKLKSLEAFAAAADGRATKIIIPSEIQGAAALAAGLVESAKGDAPNA